MNIISKLAASALLLAACTSTQKESTTPVTKTYNTLGSIEIYDKSLESILSKNASIEILAEGFDWSEGPEWIEDGQFLIFSDIKPNTIYKWSEEDSIEVYLNPSGYTGETPRGGEKGSNGLMLDKQGRLVLCQHGNRQIAYMDAPLDQPEPNYVGLATNYQGLKFNSPNDLVVHSSGDIYFTDPPYGLEANIDDPLKEIDFQGVYRWSASDSSVSLVTDQMTRPNGIAFSPDERTLYVANSDRSALLLNRFDISKDGEISGPTLFHDATSLSGKEPGSCDGMDVHPNGMVFATGPGGVWILSPEGKLLGKVKTNERTANCTFDDDYKTLYMTADSYLLRVRLI